MSDRAKEKRWDELSTAVELYAFGPGMSGLDFLERKGERPNTITVEEVFAMANRDGFDLALVVKSIRDQWVQYDNE